MHFLHSRGLVKKWQNSNFNRMQPHLESRVYSGIDTCGHPGSSQEKICTMSFPSELFQPILLFFFHYLFYVYACVPACFCEPHARRADRGQKRAPESTELQEHPELFKNCLSNLTILLLIPKSPRQRKGLVTQLAEGPSHMASAASGQMGSFNPLILNLVI